MFFNTIYFVISEKLANFAAELKKRKIMKFYKEVWGIIWEFNGIGEYISFIIGRILGVIIFAVCVYCLATCKSFKSNNLPEHPYEPIPAEHYQYKY